MLVNHNPQNPPKRWRAIGPLLSLAFSAVLISAAQAMACGTCMAGVMDGILPPVWLWALFAVLWFLTLACLVRFRGANVNGVPAVIVAILLVLGLGLAGALWLGPLGLLVLLGSPLRVAVQTVAGLARRRWSPPLARDLKIVTVAGLMVFAGLSAYSAYIQLVRSPAAYALQWEHTYAGRRVLRQLALQGQEALPDFQHLVTHGKPSTMVRLAGDLIAFERPETDVPLLILALGGCRGERVCEAEASAALRQPQRP